MKWLFERSVGAFQRSMEFSVIYSDVQVLAAIEARANVYGRHIVPLLSVSVDFYIRMFVRVFESKAAVKHSVEKLAHVLQVSSKSVNNPCAQ